MCYAVPAKILNIKGEHAKVDYGGIVKTVNISLLEGLKVGDFILVHAGFAIELVDKTKGEESLRMLNAVEGIS